MLTRASVGERKLSHAQERNDFFNLLRKKSLNPTGSIPEADFLGAADDLQNASSDSTNEPGLDCSAENGNFSINEPDRLYAEIEESHSYLDSVLDPEEEEAFLRSLGWDKNAGEEALSQEEIDAFLKKVLFIVLNCVRSLSLYCFLFAVRNTNTATTEDFHQLDFAIEVFGET